MAAITMTIYHHRSGTPISLSERRSGPTDYWHPLPQSRTSRLGEFLPGDTADQRAVDLGA